MATIKDVAKQAHVSVGTVSNVLNGKTNNRKLVKQVEDAMEQLAYYPDVRARNLKKTTNSLVGVIIPNLENADCLAFLSAVDKKLRENNFDIFLKVSQNNYQLERKGIEQCLEHHVNGILVYSPFKDNVTYLLQNTPIPSALVSEYASYSFTGDVTTISYDKALKQALEHLKSKGFHNTGLIMESGLIYENNFFDIYQKYYPKAENKYVQTVDSNQESGFISAFSMLQKHPEIQAIIISDYQLAKGAIKALKMLNIQDIYLIVIKESNWIDDDVDIDAQISISFQKIGANIADRLIHSMTKSKTHESVAKKFEAQFIQEKEKPVILNKVVVPLRFELVDSPAARALVMYSKIYTRETGNQIEFDIKTYNQLEHDLYNQKSRRDTYYDGFLVDIAWMEGFADQGILLPLDHVQQKYPEYFHGFLTNMLSEYGVYKGKLLGLPFISGTQLLFYQKDLFEDKMLRYNYRLANGEELLPPENWAQFNLIAKYFSREFNPNSPVKYGISNITGQNISTTISFLNRLWAYNSDVFDTNGNVIINNKNSLVALKNFKESYLYTSHNQATDTWEKVAHEFSTGDVAMSVLYNGDAVDINDFSKSRVAGNIGYKLIPGLSPVLGGWCLSINPFGKNIEAAIQFILWACSNENAIPISLLGGSTLRNEYYEHSDLDNVYPWKSLLKESFPISKKRVIPDTVQGYEQSDKIYTTIISRELTKLINGEIDEKTTLINLENNINRFITDHDQTKIP